MKNQFLILYFQLRMMDKKIVGHGPNAETITTCTVTFKRQLNWSRHRSMESVSLASYLP
jgi:hypothetical protein